MRPGEKDRLEARRQALVAGEHRIRFDPVRNPIDLAVLREMALRKENQPGFYKGHSCPRIRLRHACQCLNGRDSIRS